MVGWDVELRSVVGVGGGGGAGLGVGAGGGGGGDLSGDAAYGCPWEDALPNDSVLLWVAGIGADVVA
eukprot:4712780-Amphidinium_carterae.1